MRRRTKKTLGVVLVAAGLATAGVGVAGELGSWGSTTKTHEARAGAAPSSSTTTTTVPAEAAQQFLDALATALRAGDIDTLSSRLNPAVLARYGDAQCRAVLAAAQDPSAQFTVKQVAPPAPFSWTTDGKTVMVRDAWSVAVDRVTRGVNQPATLHLAPVGGRLTWFVDCGDPVGP